MAYTNSLGSTSIGSTVGSLNKLGQGLKQLKGYSPAMGNIAEVRATSTVKSGWESGILGLASAIGGSVTAYGQAKQEADYKLAEEFYKSHSQEEINNLVKNNQLEFQDNPMAMSRLRYLQGKDVLAVANSQFLTRVDRNEFSGQSPEEVSTVYHNALEEARASMSEVWGASVDDSFFKQGFYETAGETQTQFLIKKDTVESAHKAQESAILESARWTALANTPGITADHIVDEMAISSKVNGVYFTPEQKTKVLTSFVKGLQTNPQGADLLMQLKDKEVPEAGVTFGQYFGESQFDEFISKAHTYVDTKDANGFANWEYDTLQPLALEGNVAELRNMLTSHYIQNGNVEDATTKTVKKYLGLALNNQQAGAKKAQKTRDATGWLLQAMSGGEVQPIENFGFTKADVKRAYATLLESGNISERQMLNMATNSSQFLQDGNLAKQYYSSKADLAVATINGLVDNLYEQGSSGTVSVEALDKLENDNNVLAIRNLVLSYPSEARQVLRGSNEKNLSLLFSYFNATSAGVPPQECVAGMVKMKRMRTEDSKSYNLILTDTTNEARKKLKDTTEVEPDKVAVDAITMSTFGYIQMGLPREKAQLMALADFGKTNEVINGSTFPKAFLQNPSQYSDHRKIIESEVGSTINSFNKKYESKEGFTKLERKDVVVDYNHATNSVHFFSTKGGILLGGFNKQEFDRKAEALAKKELEDYKKKSQKELENVRRRKQNGGD